MGTPLPPNEPGLPCGHCWGVDKTFGDGPTPKVITLKFTGWKPGNYWVPAAEPFLLSPQLLQQTTSPCYYQLFTAGANFYFGWSGSNTYCEITGIGTGRDFFYNIIDSVCPRIVPNGIIAPTYYAAYDGQVEVSWNPEDLK